MSLHAKLLARAAENRPIRVGLIGAGKFGSMYLSQIPRTPGVHLVGIADLSPAAARVNLARVGWEAQRLDAKSLADAIATVAGTALTFLVSHKPESKRGFLDWNALSLKIRSIRPDQALISLTLTTVSSCRWPTVRW